jgi:DNA-binding transcriptional MocR family regulator
MHRVSPSTVVAAYDRLQAQGLVEARRQRGFFVRQTAPASDAGSAAGAQRPLAAPVDAAALIRAMFQPRPGPAGPGLGTLPESWLDSELLRRALRRAAAEVGDALRYGDPYGDFELRRAMARRLSTELGIAADPEQLMTAVGATHALEIVARTLLAPGDAVLVDEPGWAVEHARLARMGMRLLPVPRGPQGPDLDRMEALAAEARPRLYATVSVLHNPTGASLGLAAAHRVLRLAEAYDFAIVEDDTYAWLAPPHAPRLSALDGLKRTVYVTGFSKILAPNWRVGVLAAAPELVARFVDTKMLSSLTTPALHERAVAWCLDRGTLRRHSERVIARPPDGRARLAHRCGADVSRDRAPEHADAGELRQRSGFAAVEADRARGGRAEKGGRRSSRRRPTGGMTSGAKGCEQGGPADGDRARKARPRKRRHRERHGHAPRLRALCPAFACAAASRVSSAAAARRAASCTRRQAAGG